MANDDKSAWLTPEPAAAVDMPDETPDEPAPDYADYTKAELVEAAEAKGLDTSGNKAELLARLTGEAPAEAAIDESAVTTAGVADPIYNVPDENLGVNANIQGAPPPEAAK